MPDFSTKIILDKDNIPDLITTVDIPQTADLKPPPPPPKPKIIVEAPDDSPDIDEELLSTDLIPEANVLPPPPPPEKIDKAEEPPPIFIFVQEPPAPLYGMKDLAERLNYPEIARKVGIQGTVIISAVISETGIVEDASVLKGIGGGCDEEALRVVLATQFSPGKQRDKPVKVRLNVPIKFRLQN